MDLFGVLRRRWLLVVVGFLLTVGLTGVAYGLTKPTYEATATILLLPPASSAIDGANPYLRLGGLGQVVDLIGVALTDQATQLELQAISKDVTDTVQADPRTSSPLLLIDVKDTSPDTALKIRDILVSRAPQRLDEMQSTFGVVRADRITSMVVNLDTQAQEVGKNRLRSAVVAAGLGVALTLIMAALWDANRVRRSRGVAARLPVRSRRTLEQDSPDIVDLEQDSPDIVDLEQDSPDIVDLEQDSPDIVDDDDETGAPPLIASPADSPELEEELADAPDDASR
jgi:uncharacterized protein involved in exopolysaccharide biosynthesis